jgi:3-oxoacyl-[acyl-carrier protein] reductase
MAQGYGHIINVASSAGVKGFKNGTVYAASKFALRGMTECWREELRPHNIRVMLINPSAVPTAFNVTDRSEKELRDKMLTPNEIAHAAVAVLELDDRGFIPELGVWATNPF